VPIVVSDIEKTKRFLAYKGIDLRETKAGAFGKIVQLRHPDGNNINFAEPPQASAKHT